MADKDTTPKDDELDKPSEEVETTPPSGDEEDETDEDEEQDESADDTESDEGDEDSEDDEDSEEEADEADEDEASDEEEEKPEFKKAFSTIKGDTPEEYLPNLEEAYRKSSREAKKLVSDNKEKQDRLDQINAAVAKDPELAKAIMEATGENAVPPTADPALTKVRQDYEEKVAKDLETFMGEKSLDEDSEEMDEFMENVAIVGKAARDKGKIIDPMEAYKKAWGMMDHDDPKEKLATAAKGTASKSKTPKAKKATPSGDKPKLTPAQIAYAKKFNLTEEQLLASLPKDD